MSVDTIVAIAAYRRFPEDSELSYTAAVVRFSDNLFDEESSLGLAKAIFLEQPRVWFSGTGGLSRAKQFANLLAEETRVTEGLEFEDRPIIEITADRLYFLSRRGKRKPPVQWGQFSDPSEPWMQEQGGLESLEQIPDRAYHF